MHIELVQGDITNQPNVDVVVNAANAELAPGGGVAGAIHSAAGPELYEEAKELAPIEPGQCVLTRAYNLPNDHVIHCLGPRYGLDEPPDKILARCYRNALKLADEHKISSIAFPAISTGAFGYPIDEAAHIAFLVVPGTLEGMRHVHLTRFVLFSDEDLDVFKRAYEKAKRGGRVH